MQSSSKMKKLSEYDHGEVVFEGSHCAGRAEAFGLHPSRPDRGYLLAKNAAGEFTIFTCLTDARSGLCLTRYIPSEVMVEFARVILGGKAEPPPRVEKRYPVLDENSTAPSEKKVVEMVRVTPYFDFV